MSRSASQRKLQVWKDHFEQFSSGRWTIGQFCESVGCSVTTFYYWKRKLAVSSGRASAGPSRSMPTEQPSAFVPVVVRTVDSMPIRVRLKDGTRVDVPADALAALQHILQHAQRAAS